MDRTVSTSITADQIGNGIVPADLAAASPVSSDRTPSENAPAGGDLLSGQPVIGENRDAAPPPLCDAETGRHGSRLETSDDYGAVLFLAEGGRLRVILCRDRIQWIVQHRAPLTSPKQRPWEASSFCATRVGLELVTSRPEYRDIPGLRAFVAAQPPLAKLTPTKGATQ